MKLKHLILSSLVVLLSGSAGAQSIIALSPLQVTDGGFGLGLSYETMLDKKGYVAFYMPLALSFVNDENTNTNIRLYTYHVMPGLKFYPGGSEPSKVRYAVGANIGFVFGERAETITLYSSTTGAIIGSQDVTKSRFSLGALVMNSVNFVPVEHLYLGIEFGLGVAYVDKENGTSTTKIPAIVLLGFKAGYRY